MSDPVKPKSKIANAKNAWLSGVVSLVLLTGANLLEGNKSDPYYDMVDVLTVCRGHTGSDIVKDHHYTAAECDSITMKDLNAHGAAVLKCTTVTLSQNQYDAFTLFTYNVGGAAFCGSSILKKLNAGDYAGACDGLLAWDMAGGKHLPGLRKRREYERQLCLKGST